MTLAELDVKRERARLAIEARRAAVAECERAIDSGLDCYASMEKLVAAEIEEEEARADAEKAVLEWIAHTGKESGR
jgi:hypothetical protein